MKGEQQRLECGQRPDAQGGEARDHAAAGPGCQKGQPWRGSARRRQQLPLQFLPIHRSARLGRLVDRLEGETLGPKPAEPARHLSNQMAIGGKSRRVRPAIQAIGRPVMRRGIGVKIDDHREILRSRKRHRRDELIEQSRPNRRRPRQERAGIDRQPHEIEARPAQQRQVAPGRNGSVKLEGRPVVIRPRRWKFPRQREPGPEIDATSQQERLRGPHRTEVDGGSTGPRQECAPAELHCGLLLTTPVGCSAGRTTRSIRPNASRS